MQITSLIGKKTYQKQGFLQDGTRVPLSGVAVMGNFITQIKSSDKEGYNALQLGREINKKAKKRTVNHSKKAGLTNTPRFFKEIRVDDLEGANLGSEINVAEVFAPGDMVDVTGTSKGKGWAGGVKRYGFKGGPRTHGQSDRERAPGSIGQTTTPGRVYKGKKMAGRMGSDAVTIKNLEVIEVTSDGVLLIKGLVPGGVNTVLKIKKVGTNKKFVPLYKEAIDSNESTETLPTSDDAQNADDTGRQPISGDAQPGAEQEVTAEGALLSESQSSDSEENKTGTELTSDSPEDVQAPVADDSEAKDSNEEKKEEVKDANS